MKGDPILSHDNATFLVGKVSVICLSERFEGENVYLYWEKQLSFCGKSGSLRTWSECHSFSEGLGACVLPFVLKEEVGSNYCLKHTSFWGLCDGLAWHGCCNSMKYMWPPPCSLSKLIKSPLEIKQIKWSQKEDPPGCDAVGMCELD